MPNPPKRKNRWRPNPTSIRIRSELKNRLERAARKHRRATAFMIIEYIEQGLARDGFPNPTLEPVEQPDESGRSA